MATFGTGSAERIKAGMKRILPVRISFWHRERLYTIALVVGFLLIWEILARAGKVSTIIFPAPTKILSAFFLALVNGKFSSNTLITVRRVLSGFLIGGGAGLLLGMVLGWSRRIRRVIDPIVAALHPIPKFALLPMMLIIFGLGESSRTAMVSIGAFFPMLINTMGGVLQINPTHYEVVENLGGSKWDVFRKVVLPGSLPFVMSGARLSLISSLTVAIGVEMVFGNNGLGSVLWLAWETMRMVDLYSVIMIVSIMGIGITLVLGWTQKVLIPWHHDNRPTE
jgi:ABC-type nitrate/sulfonate/bicarbonate transport system permease component